jgi:hypothetical protein
MNATAFLPIIRSNTELDLIERIPGFIQGPTLEKVLSICHLYRVRGIASLLLNAETEQFHGDLRRSGRAFLHFLQVAGGSEKLTSHADPFFDAIASEDFECMREIAKRSQLPHKAGEEFEDDYLYIRVLVKLILPDVSFAERHEGVEHYRQRANPTTDPRVGLCVALTDGEAASFEEGLEKFLNHRKKRLEKLAAVDAMTLEDSATESAISCEALALVKLAEMRGIRIQEEYLYIPSLIRSKTPLGLDVDWRFPLRG